MSYKIALVSAFPPGKNSLNEYGYHLAINFAAHPDVSEVVILADLMDDPAPELDLGDKIRVERVWAFNDVRTALRLRKTLREEAPDLALYNLQVASFGDKEIPAGLGMLAPYLSRRSGVFSGVLAHNMIGEINLEDTVLKGQKLRQKIVSFGAKVMDWAIVHADYVTFTLPSYFEHYRKRFPKASLYHVPHGTFDTVERALTPFENRDKIIVTMGKFGTYKRLETLLAAMERVRENKEHQDVTLIIGGTDHPNHIGYMQSVEAANRDKSYLKFYGYVAEEDIPGFFDQARLSVFDYSSTTGSSGVLHQTASYGAVPVFPQIGDFVDVARDEGIRGLNYLPNDAESMAAAILEGLNNPELSKEIGETNRKAAEDMPFSEIINFHLQRIKAHKSVGKK